MKELIKLEQVKSTMTIKIKHVKSTIKVATPGQKTCGIIVL